MYNKCPIGRGETYGATTNTQACHSRWYSAYSMLRVGKARYVAGSFATGSYTRLSSTKGKVLHAELQLPSLIVTNVTFNKNYCSFKIFILIPIDFVPPGFPW